MNECPTQVDHNSKRAKFGEVSGICELQAVDCEDDTHA